MIKNKKSHYVPDENSNTPEFFKENFDYSPEEGSPYRGSIGDFMGKNPGGLINFIKNRLKKNKKKKAELDLYKKAEYDATNDFVEYWKKAKKDTKINFLKEIKKDKHKIKKLRKLLK